MMLEDILELMEKVMRKNRTCANTPALSRRSLMVGLAAAPALACAPVAGMGMTPTPASDTPAWWEKLTGPTAETDPEVFHPWKDTVLSRELGRKLDELHELLILMGAPSGINAITDFRMYWIDGVPQNVSVAGRSGPNGQGLHTFRPECGWVDRNVGVGKIVTAPRPVLSIG